MARKIHISDYYVTPVSEIELFLKEFNKHENIFDQDIYILDPCAGGCDAHEMSYPKALNQIGIGANKITTIDIREDSLADIKTNYLQYDCKFNMIAKINMMSSLPIHHLIFPEK